MKKNLRRIIVLLFGIIAITKCIYATDTVQETTGIFSGGMKIIFIGIAMALLVLILFLSYRLDKDEPIVDNDGAISNKKLNTGSKNKNKSAKKKEDLYSSFSESEEDTIYENRLEQSDFDSEEAVGFEDETEPKENIFQTLDELDDEYDAVTENTNYIENDTYSTFDESSDEVIEDDDSYNILKEIDDLDKEPDEEVEEKVEFNTDFIDDLDDFSAKSDFIENTYEEDNEMEFDTSLIDDLDDFSEKSNLSNLIEDENNEEIEFDTSVLDDLDDFENTSKPKTLASSNMPSTPRTNRFSSNTTSNSSIGFRNKPEVEEASIGFRNKKTEASDTIGFRRNSTKKESAGTTTKVRKSSVAVDKSIKTSTTTRKKKV